MSACSWRHYGRDRLLRLAVATAICGASPLAGAQAQGAHELEQAAPKWELYGGYSAFHPGEPLYGLLPGGVAPVTGCLCWNTRGAGASLTFNVNRWLGVSGDISGHWGDHPATLADRLTHADFYSVSAGPRFTYTTHHVAPFAEVLAGGHRLAPELFRHDDRFGFMAGGGVDFAFGRRFSVRLIRADYVYSDHHFGPSTTVPATEVRGVRLQSGLVYRFGGPPPTPTSPAPPTPLPPPPPPVEVIAPPTVTCAAEPSVVNGGDPSTITARGISAQNRPLVYNYQATAGSINGTGSTTTVYTAGAAAGTITVTCGVTDDKGQAAAATTVVTVVVPPMPIKPPTSNLCSISFDRDPRRPARVNNEAKACLDDIALNLERNPDSKLALIGNLSSNSGSEHSAKTLAAQRAVNTKVYLVEEKSVDASRIAPYTGPGNVQTVESVLIPPGATLDAAGVIPVDESAIKPVMRTKQSRHRK